MTGRKWYIASVFIKKRRDQIKRVVWRGFLSPAPDPIFVNFED